MSNPVRALFFSLIAALALPLHAETLHLTLQDAVSMALREGTVARLAESQAERARVAQREALSGLLPQSELRLQQYNESINLATFGFQIPGQPPVIGPFNVTDAQVTAAVQLFNLAALRYYQASRAGVEASRWHLQQARNEVAVSVARLYVMVQRAQAQANSREADLKLFEQLARVASDEFQAGTGTRLDVAQANVQLARAREALLRAQNDRESARLALLSAIGADQSQDVELAEPLTAPTISPAVEAALTSARAQRPDLREAQAAQQAAELTLASAKARRIPRVEAGFTGDYSGNYIDEMHSSRRIGAALVMPIFRGDLNANIARARLELEDVRVRTDRLTRDVEQQVRTTILTLENAQARVAVASETVKVAEDALTIARERRAAGYGSSVEVDRAEDSYRQAHEDLIAAQADAALAGYQLQYATGTLAQDAPLALPTPPTPLAPLAPPTPLAPPVGAAGASPAESSPTATGASPAAPTTSSEPHP
ncbi:MAG TPA: TolC family protein [Thermoanaerobaculia bacterium]|nr:TolC family protein [Thermoanaerobaculia bacterium]